MKPRSDIATRLRLASGLVLMVFAMSHFLTHALALHSLDAVDAGSDVFRAVWRSPPGTILLYAALIAHMVLALFKLYRRRSLRMPLWEVFQIGLGLAIPFWLAVHVVATRGLNEVYDVKDIYPLQFAWVWAEGAGRQTVMLLLVWIHGCIGLHFWLRIQPWYHNVWPLALVLAALLPGFALAGFTVGGREVQAIMAGDPTWLERATAAGNWPSKDEWDWVYRNERGFLWLFSGLIVVALGARLIRRRRERLAGKVQIRYLDGTTTSIEPGMTVLEGSRAAGVPHASVCGGRGRCSTCRIRVGAGAEHLPPPADDEAKVLKRIGTADNVRLACQIRPVADLEITPLLPAMAGPSASQTQVNPGAGAERQIAVLFADIRAFTRMAEGRLPFDVVFILNQYFKAMGSAIEGAGGRVDKFIGDGIMALFGIDTEPADACRQALVAAQAMSFELDNLNKEIQAELTEPLKVGIGLHVGPVIVGEMGHRQATSVTAIGDAVNVASRLEVATKEFGAQLLVSERLARLAKVSLDGFEKQDITIRGRQRPLGVYIIEDAKALPILGERETKPRRGTFRFARLFRSNDIHQIVR
ncbi:MAG: adenylate/guanylate cyclase domain-containing protein [Pseudomonadota bacterium]